MKKSMKNIVIAVVVLLLVVSSLSTSLAYANEDDYRYYVYDETGTSIDNYGLLKQSALEFKECTGITPFVLVAEHLGKNANANNFAQAFYYRNTNGIFSSGKYFIIVISDEEKLLDIFVSEKASSILKDNMVDVLTKKYSDTVSDAKYYDTYAYRILADAALLIAGKYVEPNTTLPSYTMQKMNVNSVSITGVLSALSVFVMLGVIVLVWAVILRKDRK